MILKADVDGSISALRQALGEIPSDEVRMTIRHAAVGAVNDSDILLAATCDGVIVAFDEDRLAVAEQELVYLERGTLSCAAPGKRYMIYREADRGCRTAVGELQVLRAREQTATALVTTSLSEVLVGDLLRAR